MTNTADLRAAALAATPTDAGLGFVCEPQGHGRPDHCSIHGDIPRTTSIISHIESVHGISREEYYALQEAADARQRNASERFVALASPDRILGILEENDELREAGLALADAVLSWESGHTLESIAHKVRAALEGKPPE